MKIRSVIFKALSKLGTRRHITFFIFIFFFFGKITTYKELHTQSLITETHMHDNIPQSALYLTLLFNNYTRVIEKREHNIMSGDLYQFIPGCCLPVGCYHPLSTQLLCLQERLKQDLSVSHEKIYTVQECWFCYDMTMHLNYIMVVC